MNFCASKYTGFADLVAPCDNNKEATHRVIYDQDTGEGQMDLYATWELGQQDVRFKTHTKC